MDVLRIVIAAVDFILHVVALKLALAKGIAATRMSVASARTSMVL